MRYQRIAGEHRRVNGWKRPTPETQSLHAIPGLAFPADLVLPPAGGVDDSLTAHAQDQGRVGDCAGQTTREVMTGLALKRGRGEELFSVQYPYYWGRVLEGSSPTDDCGMMVSSGFATVEQRGIPFKASWDDNQPISMRPPPEVDEEAGEHKSLLAFYLPTLETLKASLAIGFAVGFGFDVPSQMMTEACAESGLVEFPADDNGWDRDDSGAISGHAVSAWRFDDNMKIGNDVGGVFCLNHWSDQWGLKGRFWLPYRYFLTGHASDAHTVRLAEV